MFLSTNHRPLITETDHGTWRLCLVRFPYRFCKPGEEPRDGCDKPGDPGLRDRLRAGDGGQHEAVLAWLAGDAMDWYAAGKVMLPLPARVEADTDGWRAESDLVLAYIRDALVMDKGSHVMARSCTTISATG